MKKQIKILTMAVMVAVVGQSAMATPVSSQFNDIDYDNQYYDALEYLAGNGVVEGYDDGTFKPNNTINRAEFTKILIETVKTEDEIAGNNCFSDVKDEWFAPYVCTAKDMGVIKGYDDGNFRPADDISFVEAAKIIAKVMYDTPEKLNIDGGESGDNNTKWYSNYVNTLSKKSAIPMTINGLSKKITRGEMAEMIYRLNANIKNKEHVTFIPHENRLEAPQCLLIEYQGLAVNVKDFEGNNISGATVYTGDIYSIEDKDAEKFSEMNGFYHGLNFKGDGEYTIKVEKEGYETYSEEVTVDYAGQTGCPEQESMTIYLRSNKEIELLNDASEYCESQGGKVNEEWPIGGVGAPARNTVDYSCDFFSYTYDLFDFYTDENNKNNSFEYENDTYGFIITLPIELKDLDTKYIQSEEEATNDSPELGSIIFVDGENTYLTLSIYDAEMYDNYMANLDGASSVGSEIYRYDDYVIGSYFNGDSGAMMDMPNIKLQEVLMDWFDHSNPKYTISTNQVLQ